jgi:adenylate cyclase
LWQRRSLRLSLHETVQYVLGFSVPLLLAEHVTSTRIDAAFYGGDFSHYKYLLSALWYGHPEKGVLQMALLLAAWIHACIGLRFWLRVRPWYGAVQPVLFAAALLMCQRRRKTGPHAGARVGQFSAAFSDGRAGVSALARALSI